MSKTSDAATRLPIAAPIRLGVVGLGLIWLRVHSHMLAAQQEVFQVTGLCETDEGRRLRAAQLFPNAQTFATANELVQSSAVDAILVLTPLSLNAAIAKTALLAGKDVIMEKPIATSVVEGRELIGLARDRGRRIMVLEQLAYRTLDEQLAAALAAGVIGQVLLWQRVHHADPDAQQGDMRYDSTAWRKAGDFPLGALFDGGVHLIASLSRVFGAPEMVYASGQKFRQGYGDYDQVAMMMRYANGLTGVFSFSSCMTSVGDNYMIHGRSGAIVVGRDRFTVKRAGQPDETVVAPDENYYERMWDCLAQAVRQGVEPGYTAEQALRDVAILEAVDHSLKSGAIQRVDTSIR